MKTYRNGTWTLARMMRRRVTLTAPKRRSMWSTLAVKTSWACWYHCSSKTPLISPEQLLVCRKWPATFTAFFEPWATLPYPTNNTTNNTINNQLMRIVFLSWCSNWKKKNTTWFIQKSGADFFWQIGEYKMRVMV